MSKEKKEAHSVMIGTECASFGYFYSIRFISLAIVARFVYIIPFPTFMFRENVPLGEPAVFFKMDGCEEQEWAQQNARNPEQQHGACTDKESMYSPNMHGVCP